MLGPRKSELVKLVNPFLILIKHNTCLGDACICGTFLLSAMMQVTDQVCGLRTFLSEHHSSHWLHGMPSLFEAFLPHLFSGEVLLLDFLVQQCKINNTFLQLQNLSFLQLLNFARFFCFQSHPDGFLHDILLSFIPRMMVVFRPMKMVMLSTILTSSEKRATPRTTDHSPNRYRNYS